METNGKYYLSDIETGDWYEVSKEYHDAYIRFFELCAPKFDKPNGTIIIYGTAGNPENFDFESLFKNENNGKQRLFTPTWDESKNN